MSLSKVQTAVLFLIIANIIWGAAYPIYKWTLQDVPPFTFVFLRFYLAALILLPFTYNRLHVDRSDWKNLFLLSFFGITLTISFLIFGLKLTSSINAPIIMSSAPVILIIGGVFYLKEKLKIKTLLGTLVSLFGVLTIVLIPVLKGGIDENILGNFLLVLAAVGSVIHALLLKKILPNYHPFTIAFWQFFIGALPLAPLYFIELNRTHWTSNFHFSTFLGLAFGVIAATVIAHTIYAYGVKKIKASEVGIFTYVDPIATILVAIPLLGEKITLPYLLGSALVFLGIFVAEGRLHYHPLHKLFSTD